jgi:hypothetical protein
VAGGFHVEGEAWVSDHFALGALLENVFFNLGSRTLGTPVVRLNGKTGGFFGDPALPWRVNGYLGGQLRRSFAISAILGLLPRTVLSEESLLSLGPVAGAELWKVIGGGFSGGVFAELFYPLTALSGPPASQLTGNRFFGSYELGARVSDEVSRHLAVELGGAYQVRDTHYGILTTGRRVDSHLSLISLSLSARYLFR